MLTKDKLNNIRMDLVIAMHEVEKMHNMKIKLGVMRYSSNTFKCTLEAAVGNEGEIPDLGRANWDRYCSQFGFHKDDFGSPFESDDGRHYTISGIKPRSTKYPILALCHETNEEYKFTTRYVARLIKETGNV